MVQLMKGYHSPQLEVAVRLNTNESPTRPPETLYDRLASALRSLDLNRYPDRAAGQLRSGLARLHSVDPDQVFCANGSNEVLQALMLAFGGPGRKALVFEPTYTLHGHISRLVGTEVVAVRREPDFTIDLVAADRLIRDHRPDVVFLCSPNNPTGRAEPAELISAVCSRAEGLVVVDEAYGQFAGFSALSLIPDFANLAVVRTFSKTWSMAGLRLGYMVASPGVVRAAETVALPYHLDSVKQLAGCLALDFEVEMKATVAALVEGRDYLAGELARLPVTVVPSQANFLLFRPDVMLAGDLWQALVDRSILVRDCSTWPGVEGHLRVTVGTPEENMRFIAGMREVLA
jgi:histidinol-phosphate aminotransferase